MGHTPARHTVQAHSGGGLSSVGDHDNTRRWIRVGAFAGLAASLAYPTLLLAPMPLALTATVACIFGVSLGLAAGGTYHFVGLHRRSVSLQIGVGALAVAGVIVICMILIQLAVNSTMRTIVMETQDVDMSGVASLMWKGIDAVQLAVDVVWDVFLCVGTLLIAWNFRFHPRYGILYAWPGILIAFFLLAFNLITFPEPPAEAGIIDLGPVVGMWWFIVTLRLLASFKWADAVLEERR